ncbi:hypothetical protein K227x_12670 [Rubripirellula lacrimiformis]|uniref:Uncharacterized protein n=1 Tax=Rubripirellula lacrimiformis TaxID=1930273 RepID=A0A517N7B1_9BACT|nr:beta-ribofuranosylaminobenzene 5'-phosphate synthase [Rubripirellula lacrimiformis]QDT02888.1 hypothetical protein K227x_12670 [Rubripirellula lacrimiformis]
MNDSPESQRPESHDPETSAEIIGGKRTSKRRCVRVITGARLHFGLLDTVAPFGGMGVMVDAPATEIRIAADGVFGASDTIATRATEIAHRLIDHIGGDALPTVRIEAMRLPPSHCGLGSGTQTSLAIAEALCCFLNLDLDPRSIAVDVADRGKRSAVGVHGYFGGGMIFENAESPTDLNPVQQRIELPTAWRAIVLKPRRPMETISGDAEQQQFAALESAAGERRSQLLEILQCEILPAAESADFARFSDSVQRYNHASGMLFADVQGGPYHGRPVTELIENLTRLADHQGGVGGIGQSSWGPGVFVWCQSQSEADQLIEQLPGDSELIAVAAPLNRGRDLFA